MAKDNVTKPAPFPVEIGQRLVHEVKGRYTRPVTVEHITPKGRIKITEGGSQFNWDGRSQEVANYGQGIGYLRELAEGESWEQVQASWDEYQDNLEKARNREAQLATERRAREAQERRADIERNAENLQRVTTHAVGEERNQASFATFTNRDGSQTSWVFSHAILNEGPPGQRHRVAAISFDSDGQLGAHRRVTGDTLEDALGYLMDSPAI